VAGLDLVAIRTLSKSAACRHPGVLGALAVPSAVRAGRRGVMNPGPLSELGGSRGRAWALVGNLIKGRADCGILINRKDPHDEGAGG
jgi:hypothetical protein